MAKDRRSPYLPGQADDGLAEGQDPPRAGARRRRLDAGTGKAVDLGALLVGVYEDGELRYAGKVGAGFTADSRDELLAAIAPLASRRVAVRDAATARRREASALWLRPELVIRAEFAGWTGDGLVRQAAYKGLDLGKDPHKVRREIARTARPGG